MRDQAKEDHDQARKLAEDLLAEIARYGRRRRRWTWTRVRPTGPSVRRPDSSLTPQCAVRGRKTKPGRSLGPGRRCRLAVVGPHHACRDRHRLAEGVLGLAGSGVVEDRLPRRPAGGAVPLLLGPPRFLHTAKCPTRRRRCGARWAPRTGGGRAIHTGVTLLASRRHGCARAANAPGSTMAGTGRLDLASKQHEQCAP
jgi:hypothetical protein